MSTTNIARHWRLNSQRYKLAGNICPDCNHSMFPPRPVCPNCTEQAASQPFYFDNGEVFRNHETVANKPEVQKHLLVGV